MGSPVQAVCDTALPVEVIQCFKSSLSDALRDVWGDKPECVRQDKEAASEQLEEGLVGIISFMGQALPLSMMIGVPKSDVENITEKFFSVRVPYSDPRISDAIGELSNILAGDVLARLENIGFNTRMSLPTVVCGPLAKLSAHQPAEFFCFQVSDVTIWTKICTAPSRRSRRVLGR